MISLILLLNAIWFGLGFHLFALRSKIFAKILVPKKDRNTPVFEMLTETGKFMGGFNFAFCLLNLFLLIYSDIFPTNQQKIILFLVIAIAHGSQFLANLPIALENRKGKGVWQVAGLMRFIFITDFTLMVANLGVVGMCAW